LLKRASLLGGPVRTICDVPDLRNVSWGDDGTIVFASGTGEGGLFACPRRAANRSCSPPPIAANFAVSATGTLLYVPGGRQESQLQGTPVWVSREGQAIAAIGGQVLEYPRYPRLSPDSRRLALTTGPSNEGNLWVFDLEGRPPVPLTFEGHNIHAVWSPDGSRVAFGSNRNGALNLFWMPADGSTLDPDLLTTGTNPQSPSAWSGRELIYTEGRPGSGADILTRVLDEERDPAEVVATRFNERFAALSRDGRWLAYVSDVTGRDEIWVRPYPGPGVAPVRVSPGGGVEPVWSRDGRELFYLQGNRMMAVAVDTGAAFGFEPAVELFEEPYRVADRPSYDVGADGRFVMIQPGPEDARDLAAASLVVALNWFEELRRLVPGR
jgi:eukaryotic-like serine/threonine-protein kinase